jgi:hypothetical protein
VHQVPDPKIRTARVLGDSRIPVKVQENLSRPLNCRPTTRSGTLRVATRAEDAHVTLKASHIEFRVEFLRQIYLLSEYPLLVAWTRRCVVIQASVCR